MDVSTRVAPRGLANLGNTCFLNSTLQALACVPHMQAWARERISSGSSSGTDAAETGAKPSASISAAAGKQGGGRAAGSLLQTFAQVIHSLAVCEREDKPLRPDAFYAALVSKAPRFKGYRQHDAQELLRLLLDGLDEHEKRVRARQAAAARPDADAAEGESKAAGDDVETDAAVGEAPKHAELAAANSHDTAVSSTTTETAGDGRASPDQQSGSAESNTEDTTYVEPAPAKALQQEAGVPPTFVAATFMGRFASFVVCKDCDYVSVSHDPFLDVSLELPFAALHGAAGRSKGGAAKRRDPRLVYSAPIGYPAHKAGRGSGKKAAAPAPPPPASTSKVSKSDRAKQARDSELRRLEAELRALNVDVPKVAEAAKKPIPAVSPEWLEEAPRPALVEWLQAHAKRSYLQKKGIADTAPAKCKHVTLAALKDMVCEVLASAATEQSSAPQETAPASADEGPPTHPADATPAPAAPTAILAESSQAQNVAPAGSDEQRSSSVRQAELVAADSRSARSSALNTGESTPTHISAEAAATTTTDAGAHPDASGTSADARSNEPARVSAASECTTAEAPEAQVDAVPTAGASVADGEDATVPTPAAMPGTYAHADALQKGGLVDAYLVPAAVNASEADGLHKCLHAFCAPEELLVSAGDGYRCVRCCNGRAGPPLARDALKRLLLDAAALPPVLTIQFKRFAARHGHLTKISGFVSFPELIDLSPYVAKDESKAAAKPMHYRLLAVVVHSGGLSGGHYIAYVRCGAPAMFEHDTTVYEPVCGRDWYFISDTSVKPAELSEVLAAEAYVLFYEAVVPS